MDGLVQCPVCTLYLHNGITLESHLDTHPKDQVIRALCNMTIRNNNSNSSRSTTPANSESSNRSRSQTPAAEDNVRHNSNHRNADNDRNSAQEPSGSSSRAPSRTHSRTPSRSQSRTPRSISSTSVSRNGTSDIRTVENIAYETTTVSTSQVNSNYSSLTPNPLLAMKVDKTQQTSTHPASDYDQKNMFYPDQQEETEEKYSRSAVYNAMDVNNVFSYDVPTIESIGVRVQSNVIPNLMKKRNEHVKVMPKPNNLLNLVKNNTGGLQYLAPGVKPMHVVVGPSAPTFVHRNVQNSMIMTGAPSTSHMHRDIKTGPPLVQNHFNQLGSNTFTPGTTVVTQNSQYFYQEMVQNIDPKSFVTSMPTVFGGQENVTNVAQTSSIYQNVMLVDQFGNTSCMYAAPQMIPKQCAPQTFPDLGAIVTNIQRQGPSLSDQNKTLVIEVSPIIPTSQISSCNTVSKVLSRPPRQVSAIVPNFTLPKAEVPNVTITEKVAPLLEAPATKGLKILSNIKVEVPIQHHKNMVNTVMDLTGSSDRDYPQKSVTPENILPDIESHKLKSSNDFTQPSTSRADCSRDSAISYTELKKITSPTSNKDSSKNNSIDNKIDIEFSDSCPVPDLICNEKPSISPISELSESGDNSTDHTVISPKAETSKIFPKPEASKICNELDSKDKKIHLPIKAFRSTPLRLNNIFVKKCKKVLKIKKLKSISEAGPSRLNEEQACASTSTAPIRFTNQVQKTETEQMSILTTISIEEIKGKDEVAGFEVDQPDDVSPLRSPAKSDTTPVVIHVKEEFSSSNENTFSDQSQPGEMQSLDPLRPTSINVVTYGNMSPTDFDEGNSNRELLDLEGATKTKQFVNMMNENYFGDNIYDHYFTPDRVEAFDDKGPTVFKDNTKEAFSCNIWGEPSTKENEFVLPNFIHESYKIAESVIDYGEGDRDEEKERDIKADLLSESRSDGEPMLNICADERMPPRGELSGQESNGDMDSSWNGPYSEAAPAEPYDLMARESWVSDGSELDVTEKQDNLEELVFPPTRQYPCVCCGAMYPTMKEMRAHSARAHPPACSSYSRISTNIKKEEKCEDNRLSCTGNLMSLDSKDTIASSILQAYSNLEQSSPVRKLRRVKRETKQKKRDYICPTCKVDQVTDASFHAHLRVHPLECLKCGKCFLRRANFTLHLRTHAGIKNYKCDICEKRFVTRQKMLEHHNIHTGRAPVKCTLCDDTFRRYSNMVQHRNRHHLNKRAPVRDYVCQCGLVLHSRAKLAWHRETHDQRPKACMHCPDKFVHSASLTRHIRRKHNSMYMTAPSVSKAENVPCPICKQIYLRTNLRAHLVTHSGKRPYSCVICNKFFATKWNLKIHRWTHVSRSAKPFKCALCKGAFIRRTEYISHMNSHKSLRPYTCNYCGCQFIRKYNCQRHVREHETAKKYVCQLPECGKTFHRSYYLSEHMKVHTGVRPFSCNICGKTSSNKSNHNKHVKIHHARESVATET